MRGAQVVRAVGARLLGVVVVLWGAATLAFLTLRLIPGDPVDVMLGPQAQVSDAVKQGIREDLGLDRPPVVQYVDYLARLVQGDLGMSYQLRMPVVDVIGRQLGATVQLTALALALAVVVALVVAVVARGRTLRSIGAAVELVVVSAPVFWIGLVLLTIFSFTLHWFPVAGGSGLPGLVLPAVTLALPISALLSQVLRDGLERAEQQPFATTVRARGASEVRLVGVHTLRHAATNALTLTAYLIGSLLGGAVLVESVFGRPGIGRVTLTAITDRDMPVVMGIILMSALVFVIVNLLVDLAHRALDPRIAVNS
ncbi:ABC transporter permease [Agromyces atrinae]|uniref:ABC transporter permease n=1 Tax=Agromyces atrinae TaxID=592376 RepID=A0A4Q2M9H7_9MICO|nr:ABC transporter permease [Agromyces atrinae]NYD66206.1 peptide/nickel transport system permease protein [Agromyces atrinae]RXZ86542.1 ABC transporter permease [Agromyces atrinae]